MIKMIINNVDAEKFLNVATAVVRQKARGVNGVYCEYKLGELADGNTIDANLIDFNTVDAITELQEISPVEIYFEAAGGESRWEDAEDEELFDEALKELYRGDNYPVTPLDIFTEIVNAHHERACEGGI